MGNNPASMMKSMKDMVTMSSGGGNSGGDSQYTADRLPDGEKYFGFVNVSVDSQMRDYFLWILSRGK
jgi:hypothetical protein